jgi:hypothetical protein
MSVKQSVFVLDELWLILEMVLLAKPNFTLGIQR